MNALSHLIFRTRSKLIHWRANGTNSIETDLNNLEMEIHEAETNDASSDHSDSSNRGLSNDASKAKFH